MERRAFFSNALHQSRAPFSHLVQVGDLGFVSGIIGQNRDDGALVAADVTTQCEAMGTTWKPCWTRSDSI